MDVLLARQPIYDKRIHVLAYELLFRGLDGRSPEDFDGDDASATVVVNSILELDLSQVVGSRLAFLNATRNFLVRERYMSLPPERFVLEVLEDIRPDQEVLAAVRQAVDRGYAIALDDFQFQDALVPLIELARYVKIDVRAVDRGGQIAYGSLLNRPGLSLLAEKVETHEEFARCRDAGYQLFQGYFFCRPHPVKGRKLPVEKATLLSLLARMHQPDVDLDRIEELVAANATLGYRLLRYANSALSGIPNQIESLRHAIVMLGLERVRQCVFLLMIADIKDKPRELAITGLVRARSCQLLGEAISQEVNGRFFTVGLLSILDALMDKSLVALLSDVRLVDDVRSALLHQTGPAGEALRICRACEVGDWETIRASRFGATTVQTSYVRALSWAAEVERLLDQGT